MSDSNRGQAQSGQSRTANRTSRQHRTGYQNPTSAEYTSQRNLQQYDGGQATSGPGRGQYYSNGQTIQCPGPQQPYGNGWYAPSSQRPDQQPGDSTGRNAAGMRQPYMDGQAGPSQRSGPPSVVSSNTGSRSARSADGTGATRQDPRGPPLSNGAADALKYSMERFMGERQREEEPWKMVGSFRYVPVDQSNQNGRASGRR